jgi:ankyrin repeat protein
VDYNFEQNWQTPLVVAVCFNDANMANQLLVMGAVYKPQNLIRGTCSPVRLAIRLGRTRMMERLLMVPTIDWSVYNLNLALEFAIESKNEQIIRLIVNAGSKVDHPLRDPLRGEKTALAVAVELNDSPLVEYLLRAGAKPNRRMYVEGETLQVGPQSLLRKAVSDWNIEIVQLLLEAGANVNYDRMFDNRSKYIPSRGTALEAACGNGDQELTRLLIDAGAEINAPCTGICGGKTAFQAAAAQGHLGIVQLLLDARVDVNAPAAELSGRTALQAAAEYGNLDLVQLLLDAGADVNAPAAKNNGRTALQAAAENGRHEVLKLLIHAGADHDIPPARGHGMTALGLAVKAHCSQTVRLLLEFKADLDCGSTYDGRFLLPIQAAARSGRIDLVDMLYERGANINAAANDRWGRTALQAAAEEGHLEMVRWLLARGAQVNAPIAGNCWLTALQAASWAGAFDIVYVLLEHDADVNAAPSGSWTALETAAFRGRLDIVRLLLNVGAETIGSRALEYAIEEGHEGVVEMLEVYDF